ncbi:MAG TPA: hypothetical protein VFC39_04115 [Acidobacteriaceae bacterium]|nr:hypothetical protein [Acidobacteriaceae bacterium]
MAGLTYELRECEQGRAILGIAFATLSEITTLADNSPAIQTLEDFLQLPFVQMLNGNKEAGLLANRLRLRFDLTRQPELLAKSREFGCPKDQNKLTAKDADILATAITYKAARLTTYDPLLRFLGAEFIRAEYGMLVDEPSSSLLFM